MVSRINNLRILMKKEGINTLLIDSMENIFYLTGFTGTAGKLLITPENNYFFTDGRYVEQAFGQVKDCEIMEVNKKYAGKIEDILKKKNINKLHFESKEISYHQYLKYNDSFSEIELIPDQATVIKLRIIKDDSEIEKIKEAVKITDKAFFNILNFIKPGQKEKEIALELEYYLRKNGGSKAAFDFIVASGKRSSLPHGVAGEKKVEKGELITIDFGIKYQGYCSDMTRTIILGKPDEKQVEIYNLVLKAQKNVIDKLKPEMTTKEVDALARDIIKKAGYGENFKHGLGHGLGIDVHESPRVSFKTEKKLKTGMIITNEPGIYIADWGGVRIEDNLLITDNGCQVLNEAPKELLVI